MSVTSKNQKTKMSWARLRWSFRRSLDDKPVFRKAKDEHHVFLLKAWCPLLLFFGVVFLFIKKMCFCVIVVCTSMAVGLKCWWFMSFLHVFKSLELSSQRWGTLPFKYKTSMQSKCVWLSALFLSNSYWYHRITVDLYSYLKHIHPTSSWLKPTA